MQFEWDEKKARINFEKHAIDFIDAIEVFNDPYLRQENSTKKEYGEIRTKTIGMVGDKLIVAVISTDRNQKIRIISARRAKRYEREQYYNS
jgi:uncharacterized DUF497 family protein